ncbi:isochorismatase family protein [Bacteroidota bacterium]
MKNKLIYIKIIIVFVILSISNTYNVSIAQDPNKSALIIIDLQNSIFPVYNQGNFIQNVNTLISKADLNNVLKLFVQFNDNGIFENGTFGWQIHNDIIIEPDDITIQKFYQNSFTDTKLDSILKSHNINSIYISGLQSQYCIRQTCLGGLRLDYNVFLVNDAHSNNDPDALTIINNVNNDMEHAGCVLLETDEVNFTTTFINEKSNNKFQLSVYPNPFKEFINIDYYLQSNSNIAVKIYDVSMKEIKTLINSYQTAGKKTIVWNGLDNWGRKVANGLYIYTMISNKTIISKQIIKY